jgi:acetyltransferase-like isoleucine patch superfamily enzyme
VADLAVPASDARGRRNTAPLRIAWTVVSIFLVECVIFGLAVLPAALFWETFALLEYPFLLVRLVVLSMAFVPAYGLFALCLMALNALAMRWLGWRTPPYRELRIADFEWPLLDWVRYMVSVHVVRLFAGTAFRSTPFWTVYLRLNGARLGRRVYVNSLGVNDHNLLEFGDGVVIGDDVHLSGHTVERGVLKTAPVRLGENVTIGLGSVVSIGVEAGPGAQVGALSFVPKFAKLEAGVTYAGTPIREIAPRRV